MLAGRYNGGRWVPDLHSAPTVLAHPSANRARATVPRVDIVSLIIGLFRNFCAKKQSLYKNLFTLPLTL